MRKKFISVLLCVAMVAVMLTGCGAKSESESEATTESSSTGEAAKPQGGEITAMCVGTESDTYLEDYQSIIDDFNNFRLWYLFFFFIQYCLLAASKYILYHGSLLLSFFSRCLKSFPV